MVKINIRDKNFIGDNSSCHGSNSTLVEWVRENIPVSNSCFLTDLCLADVYKASGVKRKIAWLLEPNAINPEMYKWIAQNNRLFNFVLTFDDDLVSKGENFLYYPHGRCWIQKPKEIIDKTKFCSTITSTKNFTSGHQLRHKVCATLNNVDLFGYGYKSVIDKAEALSDYMFSITIENCRQPGYWTEKIVDCFATNTIPIYWGDRAVGKYFNADGIIFADNEQDIYDKVEYLSANRDEEYNKRKNAIRENFSLVEKYRIPEDWIAENYSFLMN